MALILIPLGRLSGGLYGNSGLYSPLIGLVFGLLLGVTDWWLLAFMLAGWLSEKPAPAPDSLGAIAEGRGTKKDYINLAKRGLISAVFFLPLAVIAETWIMLAYVISWPLAAYIGTKLPKTRFAEDGWQWSEALRHVFVGVLI